MAKAKKKVKVKSFSGLTFQEAIKKALSTPLPLKKSKKK